MESLIKASDENITSSLTIQSAMNDSDDTLDTNVHVFENSKSEQEQEDDEDVGATMSKRKKGKAGFRKAPQAPRRFKSPYILFSISKMAEYKQSSEHVQVTSISGRIAAEWKALPTEERKKWDDVALQDKLRYNAEKRLYTGPWQVPSKRTRKDPSAPKRPASAFLFFCQTQRKKLKRENPKMKNTEISKLLGEQWKSSPSHIRQPHIDREQRERESYKSKIAKWREQRQKEEDYAKQQRIAIAEQYVKSGGMSLPTLPASSSSGGVCVSEAEAATPPHHNGTTAPQQSNEVQHLQPAISWAGPPPILPAPASAMEVPIQSYYNIPNTQHPYLNHHGNHHPSTMFPPFPPSSSEASQSQVSASQPVINNVPIDNNSTTTCSSTTASSYYQAPPGMENPAESQPTSMVLATATSSLPHTMMPSYNDSGSISIAAPAPVPSPASGAPGAAATAAPLYQSPYSNNTANIIQQARDYSHAYPSPTMMPILEYGGDSATTTTGDNVKNYTVLDNSNSDYYHYHYTQEHHHHQEQDFYPSSYDYHQQQEPPPPPQQQQHYHWSLSTLPPPFLYSTGSNDDTGFEIPLLETQSSHDIECGD